jgi:hypothetical protein
MQLMESCIEHNDSIPVTLQALADNTTLDLSVAI